MKLEFNGTTVGQTTGAACTLNLSKTSSNTDGAPRVCVGGLIANDTGEPSVAWAGDIYEVLYYNKVLTPTELTCMERYLFNKYSITFP